jgi:hypothetical protein
VCTASHIPYRLFAWNPLPHSQDTSGLHALIPHFYSSHIYCFSCSQELALQHGGTYFTQLITKEEVDKVFFICRWSRLGEETFQSPALSLTEKFLWAFPSGRGGRFCGMTQVWNQPHSCSGGVSYRKDNLSESCRRKSWT